MNGFPVPGFSTLDLVRMLSAVLITAAGALACLLLLVRLKRKDYSLIYFGLGAFLYGVRLFIRGSAAYVGNRWERVELAITMVVGIPLVLFVAETVALRWKKFAQWIIGVSFVGAMFGISSLLLHQDTGVVKTLNHFLVLVIIPALLV